MEMSLVKELGCRGRKWICGELSLKRKDERRINAGGKGKRRREGSRKGDGMQSV